MSYIYCSSLLQLEGWCIIIILWMKGSRMYNILRELSWLSSWWRLWLVYSCKALVASDYTEVGLVSDRDTRNVGVRIRTRVVRFSVWNCLSAKVETVRKSVSVNWLSLGAIVSRLNLTVDASRWSLNLYTSFKYPLITIDFVRGTYLDLAESNSQN